MGTVTRRIGVIITLLLLGLTAAASAAEGPVVKQIVFEGNHRYDDSTLKYSIRTKEGQRLVKSVLAEDVSTLLTFFERVTTKTEEVPGGVKLTFLVQENPVITSVIFRDFQALTPKEILADKNFFSKKGFPFAEFKVQRDRRYLEDLLRKKGYYFAEVEASVGDYGEGKAVVFTAVEGPKVEVEDIVFVGNESFDEDTLADHMLTRESGFLRPGVFVMRTLEQDLVSLAAFYRSEGFLDAVVELRDLAFNREKDEVTITIGVEEGEPYVLSEVRIEGGEGFPADRSELEARLRVRAGERRREENLLESRRALLRFYRENAYYDARVRVQGTEDSEHHTATITFRIEEGEPVRIRRVDIVGNELTRDDVIRRNLSVYPGGPLNAIEIEKSRSRLEATGYFDRESLKAKVLDTDEPGVKDVEFRVEEGRTGSIRFSAGITSDLGLLGLVELKKRNFDYADLPSRFSDVIEGRAFTGGGQDLDPVISPGAALSQYRLAFTEPWALRKYLFYGPSDEVEESPFSFGFDLFHTLFTKFAYDERRTGIDLFTGKYWRKPGHRIDDLWSARISFRWENVGLHGLDPDAPPNAFLFAGTNQERKLSLDLGWRHVDLPASPGRGWEAGLSYELSGGFLGGEIDYHKVELNHIRYFTLYTTREEQRHILELSTRVGWAREFDGTDQVPLFDRFLAGGSGTIRGFDYGEVGPRAEGNPFTNKGRKRIRRSLRDGSGDPLGGEALWLARAEYGFPLYERILRGIVFVDAGNVTDTWTGWPWTSVKAPSMTTSRPASTLSAAPPPVL